MRLRSDILDHLLETGVHIIPDEDGTLVLRNLPTDSAEFNKDCSSVLIRYVDTLKRCLVCVDADLEYTGEEISRRRTFRKSRNTVRGWRPLHFNSLPVDATDALARVMELLGTPMSAAMKHAAHRISSPASSVTLEESDESKHAATLMQYSRDLTSEATEHRLLPTIGRVKEMDMLLSMLRKWEHPRTPVICGPSGVGKSNLLTGLASRLAAEPDAPRLLLLDLPGLYAGCLLPAESEVELKRVFDEALRIGNLVLLIDDMTALQSIGSVGVLLLKRALDGGQKLIMTTREERPQVFGVSHLERRLVRIPLSEPDPDEMFAVLTGLRPILQEHHEVELPDAVLRYCVSRSLSLPGNNPAKALDLVDLTCVQLARGTCAAIDDVLGAEQLLQYFSFRKWDTQTLSEWE